MCFIHICYKPFSIFGCLSQKHPVKIFFSNIFFLKMANFGELSFLFIFLNTFSHNFYIVTFVAFCCYFLYSMIYFLFGKNPHVLLLIFYIFYLKYIQMLFPFYHQYLMSKRSVIASDLKYMNINNLT